MNELSFNTESTLILPNRTTVSEPVENSVLDPFAVQIKSLYDSKLSLPTVLIDNNSLSLSEIDSTFPDTWATLSWPKENGHKKNAASKVAALYNSCKNPYLNY